MDLQCLASWKDGSDLFLYASVSSAAMTAEAGTYRCFVSDVYYRRINSMSMRASV